MKNKKIFFVIVTMGAVVLLGGCFGQDKEFTLGIDNLEQKLISNSPPVVHARLEMPLKVGGKQELESQFQMFGSANGSLPVSVIVSPSTQFTWDASHFSIPGEPYEGVLDFGRVDITSLRDNHLRVCGTSGNAKCTIAGIRVYSIGTPGAGLWNSAEGYGLPILTSGNTIGLGAGGAVNIAQVQIGNALHIMKLCYLTQTSCSAAATQPIPIAVDFSDAAVGEYFTTLVFEYFLQ